RLEVFALAVGPRVVLGQLVRDQYGFHGGSPSFRVAPVFTGCGPCFHQELTVNWYSTPTSASRVPDPWQKKTGARSGSPTYTSALAVAKPLPSMPSSSPTAVKPFIL